MSRIGSNPNNSSDLFEARMLPNVEDYKPGADDEGEEQGEYVDYQGDGRNTMYMAPWQKKVRNFGSRSTKVLAGRGTGKSAFLAFNMGDIVIGLARMMSGFCGALLPGTTACKAPMAYAAGQTEGVGKLRVVCQRPRHSDDFTRSQG